MNEGGGIFFGIFGLFFAFIFLIALAPLILGLISVVSVVTTPEPAFGPWWDNTKTIWLIGLLVSLALPLGGVVTGIMWLSNGRKGIKQYGVAGRPFWAGQPKPPPYLSPGHGPYPGPYPGNGPYPGPGPTPPPAY